MGLFPNHRVGPDHTLFHMAYNPLSKAVGNNANAPVPAADGGNLLLKMEHRGHGGGKVNGRDHKQSRNGNSSRHSGNQMKNAKKQAVSEFEPRTPRIPHKMEYCTQI